MRPQGRPATLVCVCVCVARAKATPMEFSYKGCVTRSGNSKKLNNAESGKERGNAAREERDKGRKWNQRNRMPHRATGRGRAGAEAGQTGTGTPTTRRQDQ